MIDPQEASRVIFGSEHRLNLLRAVAEATPEELFASKIAEVSGVPAGQVSRDLNRLKDIGLLTRAKRVSGSRTVMYSRTNSKLWDLVIDLAKEWRVPRRRH